MKKTIIEFALLTIFLFILNLLSYIMGRLLVSNFDSYVYSHVYVADELLMIIFFFSPLFLIAIRFYKRGGIIIYSIINVLGGMFFLHNDALGYGGELLSTYVFTVSKFNHLISVILPEGIWQTINITILWGCYITSTGYSYVLIRNKLISNGVK